MDGPSAMSISHQPSAMSTAVALCACMLVSCAPGSTRQADLRPIATQNVLLITIDTLRADALGSYGGEAATKREVPTCSSW